MVMGRHDKVQLCGSGIFTSQQNSIDGQETVLSNISSEPAPSDPIPPSVPSPKASRAFQNSVISWRQRVPAHEPVGNILLLNQSRFKLLKTMIMRIRLTHLLRTTHFQYMCTQGIQNISGHQEATAKTMQSLRSNTFIHSTCR